jgi:SAM-dependent methyltransferase
MTHQNFEVYADQKRFSGNVSGPWWQALQEAVALTGKPRHKLRLLDYGCGDGNYFQFLRANDFDTARIHGLEISAKRVQRCHDIGWINAALLTPGGPLPFADGSLDIVSCMEVIEHIPRDEGQRLIREFRRVLAPRGVLLISTPNYPAKRFYDFSDALLHGKWERLRDDPTHITLFSFRRLRNALLESFKIVEDRPFKPGYLYRRIRWTPLMHKMFFLCRD